MQHTVIATGSRRGPGYLRSGARRGVDGGGMAVAEAVVESQDALFDADVEELAALLGGWCSVDS